MTPPLAGPPERWSWHGWPGKNAKYVLVVMGSGAGVVEEYLQKMGPKVGCGGGGGVGGFGLLGGLGCLRGGGWAEGAQGSGGVGALVEGQGLRLSLMRGPGTSMFCRLSNIFVEAHVEHLEATLRL